MRRFVVFLVFSVALIAVTAWITSMDKVGIFDLFTWGDIFSEGVNHLQMVFVAVLIATAIGVPLGGIVTRPGFRRVAAPVIGGASIGQSIPSLAVIAIMAPLLGFGFQSAVVALVIYGLLPIVRNSYVSISSIEPAVIEAARGMGMSRWQVARKIELPLARPVIMAGIRVCTVITVGTAELAVLVGGKGLGRITFTGVLASQPLLILQGAAPTALMAIALGFLLEQVEKRVTPRGLRVEEQISRGG